MKTLFNEAISGCVYSIGSVKCIVTTCFKKIEIIYDTTQYKALIIIKRLQMNQISTLNNT